MRAEITRRQSDGGEGGSPGRTPPGRPGRGQRLGWFVLLYLVSFAVVAGFAYLVRLVVQG